MAKRIKKPSKYDTLVAVTARQYVHQHSQTILSKQRVMLCEADEADRAIVALQAALVRKRKYRAELDAEMRGLQTVLGAR